MGDRSRRIAAFDIDGTLLRWSLYISLTRELSRFGIISREALPEVERLQQAWENRQGSFTPFSAAIVAIFEKHLAGLSVEDVRTVSRFIVQRDGQRVNVFARELLRALQESGYVTVAISGSHREIVEPFAEMWGFDAALGTEYETDARGRYTGDLTKTVLPVCDKGAAFERIREALVCAREGSVAVGDTMSDTTLFMAVAYPIIINPTDALFSTACAAGYPIVTERKNCILKMRYRLPFKHPPERGSFVYDDERLHGARWSEILPPDVADNLQRRLAAYRAASA